MRWYVLRDQNGGIAVAYQYRQAGLSAEPIDGDAPELLAFIAAGTPIPNITKRQALLWLYREGVLETHILAAIQAIPDPTSRDEGMIEWAYASELEYDHPLVIALWGALGIPTPRATAFREAAQI